MAFHFVHNLIEKIKAAYNRPYEEARREKLEHQRKIWAEQGKEAKERQASDSFIHYCIKCYAYASVLPLTWEGGHMGCGGGVRGFPAVSKESFDAMSEEEKAKVKDQILKYDAELRAANLTALLRWQATHTSKCPMCQSTNFTIISPISPSVTVTACDLASRIKDKHFKCNNCGLKW